MKLDFFSKIKEFTMIKLLKIPILCMTTVLLFCCLGSMELMAQNAEKQQAVKTFKQKSMDAHTHFIEQHSHLETNLSYIFSNLYSTSPESLSKWIEIRSFLLTQGEHEMGEDVTAIIDIMTNKLAEN